MPCGPSTRSGARFTGFAGGQQMLFGSEADVGRFATALLARFAGQAVSVEMIERFVIEETDFKTTQYKKAVLKELEVDGIVVCGLSGNAD